MIFRAIVAVGLICVLAPNEPDLGFGRPSSIVAQLVPELAASIGLLALTNGEARDRDEAAPSSEGEDRASLLDRLRAIKADIERDRERRLASAASVGDERRAAVRWAARTSAVEPERAR